MVGFVFRLPVVPRFVVSHTAKNACATARAKGH